MTAPSKTLLQLLAATSVIVGVLFSVVWFLRTQMPVASLPAGISQDQYLTVATAWQARHGREPEHEDVLVQLDRKSVV